MNNQGLSVAIPPEITIHSILRLKDGKCHLWVDITSKIALSDFVERLKQESSYLFNTNKMFLDWAGWLEGTERSFIV